MSEPTFWMTMVYECESCGNRVRAYLETGCEGPSDGDRQVVPVPFTVTCDCGGFFRHIAWNLDQKLIPAREGIPEAPHFRYPSRTEFKRYKDRACGRPVGFAKWCTS